MAEWHDYEWLVICGSIVAFCMAWSIGANDVANSFATSVGSRSLTIGQAVCIATCCEFLGSMLLGGQVVKTIAGGIADPNAFAEEPEFLAYGMLCVITAAFLWVTAATAYGFAVSSTHSAVGGVIGFALCYKGNEAVIWYQKALVAHSAAEYKNDKKYSNFVVPSDQIPIRGIVPIIISWFTSPISCAMIAATHFFLVRTFVMRRKNALQLSYFALPIVVLYCIFMNTFFVVYKGGKTGVCTKGSNGAAENSKYSKTLCYIDITGSPNVKPSAAAWIAAAVAGGICALVCIFIVPFVIRHANTLDANGVTLVKVDGVKPSGFMLGSPTSFTETTSPMKAEDDPNRPWYKKVYDTATYGMRYDIHAAVQGNHTVSTIKENAEKFDPRAELSFRPVQVFTSMCVSFAHGANDVANAVGPLAAIFAVYKTRTAQGTADLPTWILAIGACGIVAGLATYGYNIMRVLGTEMVLLTPCRGFSAELATAMVISVGSMYGFPLSTTHCQTGSTIGVGLLEHGMRGVNWWLFLKQFIGWVFTLIVCGFISAALFAQACYAPSVIMSRDIQRYQDMGITLSRQLIETGLGKTYDKLKADFAAASPGLVGATFTPAFEANFLKAARLVVSTNGKTWYQNITAADGTKKLRKAAALSSISMTRTVLKYVDAYQQSTVITFGGAINNGTGWDKNAYRAQRGSDFAALI